MQHKETNTDDAAGAGAIASIDRGKGIPHQRVKEWVAAWETRKERRIPKAA